MRWRRGVIKTPPMKSSNVVSRRGLRRSRAQRAELLDAFARSGLAAAEFARRHGLHYTTLYNWRRARSKTAPAFVEVQLPAPASAVELVIELGPAARLRLTSEAQLSLAAGLLRTLHSLPPC